MNNDRLSTRYMTIGEAALYLDVNRITIRRWLKSGNLKGERIGHFTLILKTDIYSIASQQGIVGQPVQLSDKPILSGKARQGRGKWLGARQADL